MQNDYQPGEDLTITIAHIKHNIKVLAVIHKQAQALLDKPIEALYAATDAFEEGEPVNMPMSRFAAVLEMASPLSVAQRTKPDLKVL